MKKSIRAAVIASISSMAMLLSAQSASAAVTLDSAGSGSVGKGDIQVAFGWNNKQMQANYLEVTFEGRFQITWAYLCEGTNGRTGVTVEADRERKINSALDFEVAPRKKQQFSGWLLTGPTISVESDAPATNCTGQTPTYVPESMEIEAGPSIVEFKASFAGVTRSWTRQLNELGQQVWTLQP